MRLLDRHAYWPGHWAHALNTQNILSRNSALADMAFAAAHHERLDSKGYPLGLKADEISFETRVITIADFFDALTADRPYLSSMSVETALEIIGKDVGDAVDPACFEAPTEYCRSRYGNPNCLAFIDALADAARRGVWDLGCFLPLGVLGARSMLHHPRYFHNTYFFSTS